MRSSAVRKEVTYLWTASNQSYFSSANNFSFSFYIILGENFLFLYSFSFSSSNNSSFYLVLG